MMFIAKNRFKCPSCSKDQCKTCGKIPFHLGFTCDESENKILCRYCIKNPLNSIVDLKRNALSDICLDSECHQIAQKACQKIMPCNHRCSGVKNHKVNYHFCTKEDCPENIVKNKECVYCTTTLCASPTIYSTTCLHGFHYDCISKSLEKKHHTKRITFGYMNCPECRQEFALDGLHEIDPVYKLLTNCLSKKEEMAQLIDSNIHEDVNVDKNPLKDASHRFYRKPISYGLTIYSIYECFRCRKPYIGGQVPCDKEEDLLLDER